MSTQDSKNVVCTAIAAIDDGCERSIELLIAEDDIVVGRQLVTDRRGDERLEWVETSVYRIDEDEIAESRQYQPSERIEAQRSGLEPPFSPLPLSRKSQLIARAVGTIARITPPARNTRDGSVESNRMLVRRYIEEFKNEQKFQVFPRLFAHDFRHHFDFDGQTDTAASFVNVGVNLLDGFPDVQVEIIHLIAQDDLVVEHNRVSATHTATWAGHDATGRTVHWNEVHIYRIANGRIVENWPYVDFDKLVLQVR